MPTRYHAALARLRPHALRAGWATSEALIGPVLLLLMSPWLLKHLGSAGFGLWALAVSISSFGSLASLGVGLTTTKHVSADLAAHAPERALAVTRAGLTVAMALGCGLLLVGAISSSWIAAHVFEKMGNQHTVGLALMAGLGLLVVQEVDSVFSGALRGAGRFDTVAKVELASRPVWALAVAFVATSTGEVGDALAASLLINAAKLMLKATAASKVLAGACARPSTDVTQIMRIVRFGTWVWAQGIGTVLFSTVDRLLVGSLFGAADLGRYSLCLQLAQFVHSLQAAALQTVMPWVSARSSRSAAGGFLRLKQLALQGGLACLIAPILVAVASHWILTLWIGPAFADDNRELLSLLLVGIVILSLSTPVYFVLIGLGDVRFVGILVIACGVAALGTSMLVANLTSLGTTSFAVGRTAYGLVMIAALLRLWRLDSTSTKPVVAHA